jgi:hypothetical protein
LLGGRWSPTSESFTDDGTEVVLTIDEAPDVVWTVTFGASCSMEEVGEDHRVMEFEGGCVSSTVEIPTRYDRDLVVDDVDQLLLLVERSALDDEVREQTDGELQLDP